MRHPQATAFEEVMSQLNFKDVFILRPDNPALSFRMTEEEFRRTVKLEAPLPLDMLLQQPQFRAFDAQLAAQGIKRQILVPISLPRVMEGCLN
jgi:hypothetical protein